MYHVDKMVIKASHQHFNVMLTKDMRYVRPIFMNSLLLFFKNIQQAKMYITYNFAIFPIYQMQILILPLCNLGPESCRHITLHVRGLCDSAHGATLSRESRLLLNPTIG